MNYRDELIGLLDTAIKKVDVLKMGSKHIDFLGEFKETLVKIMSDARSDSLPITGSPRGLTRWLGDYIDQMEDKSVWNIIVQIDELLKNHY